MTQANPQSTDPDSLELKLPDESAAWKDIGLWAGVLVLLTMIAYWPSTTGSFLWRDDQVAQNKTLLGPGGLSHIWLDRWQNPDQFTQAVYQPVADTAFWLEYRAGGHNDQGVPTPTAYHVASLLFHAGAVILLWLTLRELLIPGSWLIAAIFALHPIHAEDVSWISEQSIVLAGLFFFASIYLYLLFVKSIDLDRADRATGGAGVDPAQTWGFYAGSIGCGFFALLSHPSTTALPILILILLWWRKRIKTLDVLLQLPLVIVVAILWFKNLDLHKDQVSFLMRAQAIGHGLGFSLLKLFVPFGQSIIYLGPPSRIGLFIFILAILGLLILYAVNKNLFVALAAFVLIVCFSINWFDSSRLSWLTDSTAYLAIVPLIALMIGLVRPKVPGPHPQTVVTIAAVLLLALGTLAWVRTHAFDNPVALWRDTLHKEPAAAFAETSLAEQLRLQAIDDTAQGNTDAVKAELDESIAHAQAVLKQDSSIAAAQRTWADVLVAQGDYAAALPHFAAATQLDPTNAGIRTEYASALIKLGRFQPAVPQLNEALKWDVSSSATHHLLGQAYLGLNNTDRAILEQQLALGIDPSDFEARESLAQLQVKTGKLKQAIESYAMILGDSTQQKRPELWVAVAKIKDQQGAYAPAVQYLQTAQQLSPDDADTGKLLDVEKAKLQKQAATQPAATQMVK